jgi:NitT/TauT family transport system permease protein
MKRHIKSWLVYLGLWEILARLWNRPVLLPSFSTVLRTFAWQLVDFRIIHHVINTLVRVGIGVGISFVLALCLAVIAYEFKRVRPWLNPLLIISRSVPNITFILLILIWFSREISVTIIVVLIVFPVFYAQLMGGLMSINSELLDVLAMYPEHVKTRLIKVYLPSLQTSMVEGLKSALSLGFKVAVMAEILGQVQPGLGYLMHVARTQFDMQALFAYTLWMITVIVLIESLIEKLHQKTQKAD